MTAGNAPSQDNSALLVVEDMEDDRNDLVEFLQRRGFDARGVGSGSAMDEALAEAPADLVILDVNLPGESGVSIAARLKRTSDIGILMLTCRDRPHELVDGLDAGADAYLVKGTDLLVVEATVRSVLRRIAGRPGTPALPRQDVPGIWTLDPDGRALALTGQPPVPLSASERRIIALLFAHRGHAVPRDDLVRALGRSPSPQSQRNLDNIVRRLRRKVEAAVGRPLPLSSVYGVGYTLMKEE